MSRRKSLDSLVEDRLRVLLASKSDPSDAVLKLIDSATGFLKAHAKGKQPDAATAFWDYVKGDGTDDDPPEHVGSSHVHAEHGVYAEE